MDLVIYCLLPLLMIGVVTDLRQGKIPNPLVLIGAVAGVGLSAIGGRGAGGEAVAIGIATAVGGMLVGLLSLSPLYAVRAMGAGDVKLMMMVGAFLGPLQTFGAVVLTFAAGGVLAISMAIWQRSLAQLAINLRFMLTQGAIKAATGEGAKFEPLRHTAGRMPYAVAIFAGTLLQLILVRSGGWALS